MLETTKEIIAVASAAIGVLATGVPLLIGFFHNARKLVRERDRNRIAEALSGLIAEAERFRNYSGAEKKEYVKSRLAVYAAKNRITSFTSYRLLSRLTICDRSYSLPSDTTLIAATAGRGVFSKRRPIIFKPSFA